MLDVGTLHDRHGGRWQIAAGRAGGQVIWLARPQQDGQKDPFSGWDAPDVLTAATAEELDALLAQAPRP